PDRDPIGNPIEFAPSRACRAWPSLVGFGTMAGEIGMQRLQENAAEAKRTSYELFDGDVTVQGMVLPANGSPLLMHSVSFADGARTKWHTHGSEQVIIVTDGTGIAAIRDE